MKKHLLTSLSISLLLGNGLSARTFTDTQGREIEASVIEVHETSVTLKLDRDGKVHIIPFSKISEKDVTHLKSLKKEATTPPPLKKLKKKNRRRGANTEALMQQYNLKENFEAPWPALISVSVSTDVTVVTESTDEKKFVYHSPNYEFIADVRLSKNVVNKFAVMFEATREYCRLLPVSSMKAHIPGAQRRNTILLFEEYQSYIENGGSTGSAGIYLGSKNIVMVPLQSLGVKKVGSGYMYDHDKSNKTLTHEIIHQLTDHEYYAPGARGWFSEGFAEYCANTPYRSGKFMVKTNRSAIEAYATAYGKDGKRGRNMGEEFSAPDLQSYMTMSYSDFTANANFNYGFGMLLTYYFFHMENDRSNITAFLKALKEGKAGQDALEVLLNGRSYKELQEQVRKKWKSKGVKINFTSTN